MEEKVAGASLQVVSIAAGLSLLLPSVDKAHESRPMDDSFTSMLRSSSGLYTVSVLSLALLQSIAVRSLLPLLTGAAFVAVIVGWLEQLRRSHSGRPLHPASVAQPEAFNPRP